MRREKGTVLRILSCSLLRGLKRVSITGSVEQALENVWSLQPRGRRREKKRGLSVGEAEKVGGKRCVRRAKVFVIQRC